MIAARATGARPIFGREGGGKVFGLAGFPEIRIDEDTMNITIDTLMNITIDHYPRQGGVTVRAAGGPRLVAR